MYKVFFDIWRGFSSPTSHPAGVFESLDDAKDCASKCHGYIMSGNSLIADYRKN